MQVFLLGLNDWSNLILLVLLDINHTVSWLSTSILRTSLNSTNRILNLIGPTCLKELNWKKKFLRQHQDMKLQWKEAKRRYPLPICKTKVTIHGRWWQRQRWKDKTQRWCNLEGRLLLQIQRDLSRRPLTISQNITKLFWQMTFQTRFRKCL